ncbi:TetR/AcrR family transcriptional regulator C-terminal domain-containing protein [Actinophytocola sp.]|uniref:TetR/AcrR family transcriptional regulator C-terminal domain-containing protein n=1 Tax=Actinophytocola sp. TaxID=1872138 RepID=UPI002D7FC126|nr:TetR/AcrR family transcriptional regulator C-terminal domain-containing protein [Actinophytocola sp.]HET9141519.1 TetR/AcrR family transcriptional regulator C-terminal domain-containing protein [Actinophytocola sp.]
MPYAVKAMPRPRSLSQADVAVAALAVIDRDGLAALTMRSVAGELGLATMGLYRYVLGREQLEQLVADHVLAAVDTRVPARGGWPARVSTLAARLRAAVATHPEVVPLIVTHRATCPAARRWAEATLEVLAAAGFAGMARVIALRALLSYLIGSLQLDDRGSLTGPGTAALAALPAGEYPLLAETARLGQRVSPDEEFRRGLIVLLRGLEAALSTPD